MVLEELASKGDARVAAIRELPQHWRAVYTTLKLQFEVDNGGHHQFFWNSEGALNEETLNDLQLIEAGSYVDIFAKALRIFKKHDYRGEKAASGYSWEGFTAAYKRGPSK